MAEKIEKIEIEKPIKSETTETPIVSNNIPIVQKTNTKLYIIIGFLIGLLVCSGTAFGFYYYFQVAKPQKNLETKIPSIKSVTPETSLPVLSGIKWLATGEQINSIKVFKSSKDLKDSMYLTDKAIFTKTAQLEDGSTLINALLPQDGPGGGLLIRFIKNSDGVYSCLRNYLDPWTKDQLNTFLLPEVKIIDKPVEGLVAPETISIENVKFFRGYEYNNMYFDSLKNPTKKFETPNGQIYQTLTVIDDKYSDILARNFYLRLKDNIVIQYSLDSGYNKNKEGQVPLVIWENGDSNNLSFTQAIVSGCGGGMVGTVPIIRDNSATLDSKMIVGKTVTGDEIDQVIGENNQLIQYIYNNYKIGRDYAGGPSILPISEFLKNKTHFIWKDSLGDWQIFVNSEYVTLAECGKPVIYLYPEKKNEVNVKVGAKIRLSDPLYPESGWQVTAFPDGKLNFQGKNYDSLFWEGLGKGIYPDTKGYGFVVSQKDLISTLQSHLKLLGLNEKESADFQDFWVEKLPETPYVRLTWLGTRDMNILAPLEVTPKPDTQIRIFLEFEGLEKPVNLTPQRLSAPKRNGFTLIEWGGLLQGQ